MIWIIGDIHGMFDPLKRLVSTIWTRYRQKTDTEKDKLIFIGDYIDHGPSSKEVIDYLMNLPLETVFLMGNHDDLLLQFIDNSELVQRFGNVWFRGNGGQQTVKSFFPETNYEDHQERLTREEFPLEDVYIDFFKNLKITHTEKIGNRDFAFAHGMFNINLPLDEQLALKTYDDYHTWRKENKIWIEDTLLWSRNEPKKKFGDYIFIHGHIPTPILDNSWKNLHGYDLSLEMPFLKFEEQEGNGNDEISFYEDYNRSGYTGTIDQLISIDVDTGAVYGNSLTAIGLSEKMLDNSEILVYQVSVSKGYRMSNEFNRYTISFNGF